jgi:hypothetical protein
MELLLWEIKKILIDVYKKLITEINTKIANKLFICFFEIK